MKTERAMRVVPTATLRRMPIYLQCLRALERSGVEWVSCTYLAERLQRDATLVRKDLAMTGLVGKPKVGFHLPGLIASIEHFIGWDNREDAFLVGVGHLGTALLGYEGFEKHGMHIVAGFDVDPAKVGTQIQGKAILPVEKLADLARRMRISIGIVTVGAPAAQGVAERMVAGGIRAIWNFAPVRLEVPAGVIVENEDLAGTLAVLSQRLAGLARDGAVTE